MVEEKEPAAPGADPAVSSVAYGSNSLHRLKISLFNAAKLFRSGNIDISTEAGRGAVRIRNSLLTSVSSVVARGAQVIGSLITLPIILHHLGLERYGLLATVSSMAGMLLFSDLGIGNSLINVIARLQTDDRETEIVVSISTAFYVLLGIALLLIGVAAAMICGGVAFAPLLNLKSPQAISEVNSAVLTFIVCFSMNMPFGIVQKTQLGFQCGYYSNYWLTAGSLLTVPAVLLVSKLNLGVSAFLAATLGAQLAAAIVNHLWYFLWHAEICPKLSAVSLKVGRALISAGILFLGVQSVSLLLLLSDNVIVAHLLGAAQVGILAIPTRLVGIIALIPSFVVVPLWAAFGEAEARADYKWICKTLRSSNITTAAIAFFISLALVLFGQTVIRHWVGHGVYVSQMLIAGVTMATFLVSVNASNSIFLMGTGRLKASLLMVVGMLLLAIVLKVWLVGRFGLASIGWLTSIAQLLCLNIPMWIYVRRITNDYKKQSVSGMMGLNGDAP